MADLTTLDSIKAYLGIDGTADDAILSDMVTAYSNWFRRITGRTFTLGQDVIERSGRGEKSFHLPQTPIVSVQSLMIDGQVIPAQSTFGSYGYRFNDRAVTVDGTCFRWGSDNIRIAYTAGYAEVPPEIGQAVNELIGLHFKNRDRIGFSSKSLAGETIAFITKAMPDSVRTLINDLKQKIPL